MMFLVIDQLTPIIHIMEIKYTYSTYTQCYASYTPKTNKLKKCSYLFNWIFSNCDNVIHAIQDDFNIFLDKNIMSVRPKINVNIYIIMNK